MDDVDEWTRRRSVSTTPSQFIALVDSHDVDQHFGGVAPSYLLSAAAFLAWLQKLARMDVGNSVLSASTVPLV